MLCNRIIRATREGLPSPAARGSISPLKCTSQARKDLQCWDHKVIDAGTIAKELLDIHRQNEHEEARSSRGMSVKRAVGR